MPSLLSRRWVAQIISPCRFGGANKLTVMQTDLLSFHEVHFGKAALEAFAHGFLDPDKAKHHDSEAQHPVQEEFYEEEYYYEDEEDDGLGYYPDGVKRTLTDEQIAMFRHSELQTLQRARDKNQNNSIPVSEVEEGELADDDAGEEVKTPVTKVTGKKKHKKKRGSGKGNSTKPWEPDPERRKRTWDVVETGLDGLDYGETEISAPAESHVAQRRRITYDDD